MSEAVVEHVELGLAVRGGADEEGVEERGGAAHLPRESEAIRGNQGQSEAVRSVEERGGATHLPRVRVREGQSGAITFISRG